MQVWPNYAFDFPNGPSNESIAGGLIPNGALAPTPVLYNAGDNYFDGLLFFYSSPSTYDNESTNTIATGDVGAAENGSIIGLGADAGLTWENGGALYTEVVNGANADAITFPINLGPSTGVLLAMTALPNGGYAVAWATGQYPDESAFAGDQSDLGPEDIASFNSSNQEIKLDSGLSQELFIYSAPAIAAAPNGDVIVVANGGETSLAGEIYDSFGNMIAEVQPPTGVSGPFTDPGAASDSGAT
jgi:hypothetical protein